MANDRRQITRTRISYSCQTCRRRKVKCDKTHPVCGGCQKVGETCVYGEGDSVDANDDVQQRKRKADVPWAEEFGSVSVDMISYRALENKLNHLNALMNEIGHLKSPDSNGNGNSQGQGFASPSVSARHTMGSIYSAQHIRPKESANQNGNAANGGKTSVFDQLLKRLDEVNVMLKHNTQLLSQPPAPTTVRDESRVPTATQLSMLLRRDPSTNEADGVTSEERELQRGLIRDLVENVSDADIMAPTQEECNVLFRSWLWSTYSILPLISPHDILSKYYEFRKWYDTGLDRGQPNPDPSFTPLLTAIWYAGVNNLSAKGHQRWFPWAKYEHLTLAMRARLQMATQTAMYPTKPTPISIAANITLGYLLSQDHDKIQNSAEITATMRAAQIMGLHNERTFQSLPLGVAETRRRLFWEATNQDVSLSAVSGMPPILDEFYSDTSFPSELKESLLGTDAANEYEARLNTSEINPDRTDDPLSSERSSMISVHHLVSKARYIIATATRKVLKFNMGARQMTMDDMKAIRRVLTTTSKDVRAIIDRITTRGVPEMDFVPQVAPFASTDHHDSMGAPITAEEIDFFLGKRTSADAIPFARHHRMVVAAFHKWARIALSLMLDRLSCLSYSPFLKNAKSRLWGVARSCALKDCHAFLRKFISLGTDPELERFRWCWPVLFQPMHAAIIVLIDLYERPFSQEAPRSRAFIDKLFMLATPETGIVGVKNGVSIALPLREGGAEAWDMLRNLRQKGWQKAGLDPELLWTEEDQIEVGVSAPLSENQRFIRSLREDVVVKYNEIRGMPIDEAHTAAGAAPSAAALRSEATPAIWMDDMSPQQLDVSEAIPSGSGLQADADPGSYLDKQQHLLLRARHDQQSMPYPLSQKNAMTRSESGLTAARRVVKNPPEEGEITHVSELIRKIKSMRTNAGQEPSKNGKTHASLGQSSVDRPVLNSFSDSTIRGAGNNSYLSESFECTFRKDQEVERAALDDIHDRNMGSAIRDRSSTSQEPVAHLMREGTENANNARSTQQTRPTSGSTDVPQRNETNGPLSALCLPPQTQLAGDVPAIPHYNYLKYVHGERPPHVTPSHSPIHDRPRRSIFLGNSIQPQFADPSPEPADRPSEPETVPSLGTEPISHQDFAPSTNTSAPSEVAGTYDTEFDWEKWDNLFSNFTGFEDLLESGDHAWMAEDHAMADADGPKTSFWGVAE